MGNETFQPLQANNSCSQASPVLYLDWNSIGVLVSDLELVYFSQEMPIL